MSRGCLTGKGNSTLPVVHPDCYNDGKTIDIKEHDNPTCFLVIIAYHHNRS